MKFYLLCLISVLITGCLSSNDNDVDDYTRKIICETKIEFPIDTALADSLVTIRYSLVLRNLIKGIRHKTEVIFKSQEMQFIQSNSNESFSEDSVEYFQWSILRKKTEQEGSRIHVTLEINGRIKAQDTATYIKPGQNSAARL